MKKKASRNLCFTGDQKTIDEKGLIPNDFFGWLLLAFVIGSLTLTGAGQLRSIGLLMAGGYTLYFLKNQLGLPKEMMIFVVWVVWSGATGYLVSIDKGMFLSTFKVVFQNMVMSFAILGITASRGCLKTNFLAFVIGGIILFLSSVTSGELFSAISGGLEGGVKGLTSNQNDYGYSLLLCVAALLFFWRNASLNKRIIIILLFCIFSTGIIFSDSRKSFVGLILLVFLWLFMCYRKELFRRVNLFVPILFAIGGLYFATDYMLSNTHMGKRFKGTHINIEAEQNKSIVEREEKRTTLYKEGFELLKQHPIFGVGLGNFKAYSYYGIESHSDYIEVAASTGIIGFLLYFSIYALLWNRFNRIQKQANDPSILSNVGLLKAIILTILVVAFGRPNFSGQTTLLVLGSIIGYSWSLETKLFHLNNT